MHTGHQQLVNHVSFSPDGRFICSGCFDKSVRLWDGVTGKLRENFLVDISALISSHLFCGQFVLPVPRSPLYIPALTFLFCFATARRWGDLRVYHLETHVAERLLAGNE